MRSYSKRAKPERLIKWGRTEWVPPPRFRAPVRPRPHDWESRERSNRSVQRAPRRSRSARTGSAGRPAKASVRATAALEGRQGSAKASAESWTRARRRRCDCRVVCSADRLCASPHPQCPLCSQCSNWSRVAAWPALGGSSCGTSPDSVRTALVHIHSSSISHSL